MSAEQINVEVDERDFSPETLGPDHVALRFPRAELERLLAEAQGKETVVFVTDREQLAAVSDQGEVRAHGPQTLRFGRCAACS